MTDWTIIATTAIATTSGLVGAALGFLGARTQATSEVKKLQLEQEEARHRDRQGIYHRFLDSAYRIHRAPPTPEMELEFEHQLTAVSLFGTRAAWHAAHKLADVAASPPTQINDLPALLAWRQQWDRAYQKVIEEMRLDTAPEEQPSPFTG